VWLLKSSLADVTASQPSLVNTDWIALTQPVQTGSIALTSEFTVEGDNIDVGMLVGLYSNGKVRAIKNHPGEVTFAAATATFVNDIALTSTLGIKVYRDESDGNKVKAILCSIAGRKQTVIGTPTTIASTSATYIHADKIDANNIIIVYQDTSDSSQGKAVAVNIAANVITKGTPAVFNAGVSTYCKVAVLTTAKAVIVYRDEGNSNYGVANTVAIAGLVLTPATEVNFRTATVSQVDVCRLSDTSAAVSYVGAGSYPEATALTINPGIVVGTSFALKTAVATATTLSRLTDTTFVAAYNVSSLLYARHVTNAAGTLSAGTELPIQANATSLESCQLTSTRVIVTGRNWTVSNQGFYWLIDNTSGTTIANNVSGSFNSGATSYTFPSKILDNRVLVGYQDNGSSNNGVSYVLDLSTETLKSIAGVAKEAGVESNVIDVVTQGECDFLSGLTPGSYYYSSATGFLSASVGDYEVGVAKSATNLLMLERITKVNAELMKYIDELYAAKATPSYVRALQYNIWTTREIKTSSGTFTVPAGVYYIGIACVGKGGNSHDSSSDAQSGAGGGGLTFSLKKVIPGQSISYTISGGIAFCENAIASFGANGTGSSSTATGGTGGSASGGDYNYSGGAGGNATINSGGYTAYAGGGGAGGGAGGNSSSGQSSASRPGGGGGRAFPDNVSWTPGGGGLSTPQGQTGSVYGGGGSPRFAGGEANQTSSGSGSGAGLGGAGLTATQTSIQTINSMTRVGKALNPLEIQKMGLCSLADTFIPDSGWDPVDSIGEYQLQTMPFGSGCLSNISATRGSSFGGAGSGNQYGGNACGFGGGSGGTDNTGALAGVLGGAGAGSSAYKNTPGYGGGAGAGYGTNPSGGAAIIIFIY
jgi:hypothetical protein